MGEVRRCVSSGALCGCVGGCLARWAVLHLDEGLGLRGRPSAYLGSHWTAGFGVRRQAPRALLLTPGEKSTPGLHKLSVRPPGHLGRGHGKRARTSTEYAMPDMWNGRAERDLLDLTQVLHSTDGETEALNGDKT